MAQELGTTWKSKFWNSSQSRDSEWHQSTWSGIKKAKGKVRGSHFVFILLTGTTTVTRWRRMRQNRD